MTLTDLPANMLRSDVGSAAVVSPPPHVYLSVKGTTKYSYWIWEMPVKWCCNGPSWSYLLTQKTPGVKVSCFAAFFLFSIKHFYEILICLCEQSRTTPSEEDKIKLHCIPQAPKSNHECLWRCTESNESQQAIVTIYWGQQIIHWLGILFMLPLNNSISQSGTTLQMAIKW